MNLLRKMSSKLRSSKELSASGEQLKMDDVPGVDQLVESPSDREPKVKGLIDDGDVFEDAAADPVRQQAQQQRGSSGKDEPPIRVRAPVTDEKEDEDGGRAREDEEEEAGEEDGAASQGSGESFDSALERMAASSDASFDTALSPKISSPAGSLPGPAVSGNPPASADAPTEKSEGIIQSDQNTAKLEHDDDAHSVEPAAAVDGEPRSPMPKAKLTAEDESDGDELVGSEEEEDDDEEEVIDNGVLENDANEGDEVKAGTGGEVQHQPEISDKEAGGSVGSGKARNKAVRNCNGDPKPVAQQAMPKAKLSTEDEDGTEGRDFDEFTGETAGEDDVQNDGWPLKIRAVPSDLDDSVVLPVDDYENPKAEGGWNDDENSRTAKIQESSKEADGTPTRQTLTRPSAKLSDDGVASLVDDPEEQSVSSGAAQLSSRDLPVDKSVRTGGPDGASENMSQDSDALGPVSERSAREEAVKGVESMKIPSEETDGADVDDFLRNVGAADESEEDAEEDEEDEEDEEGEEENEDIDDGFLERSEALAALLRGAESAARGESVTTAPSLGSAGPSLPARPTRTVRSSLPSLDPAPRPAQQPRSAEAPPVRSSSAAEESSEPADGNQETREKLQSIRVKFLRLALRLGQSPHNVVVAQVLYRLGLAEQLRGGRGNSRSAAFSFDGASRFAEEQERAGPEELDFSCTIMILGKTGVGKSATINSIFDEAKTKTNAFSPATSKVQVITGLVHGIKVRVIDTPGLLPSVVDHRRNERTLASVKGFIKKQSPDIVLYFDRLDMQSRDYSDLPLLRTITDTFGASVWFNAIVVLTHASSAPPDGPNGVPLSYETFVSQRSHVVQQTIRQAAGDMRLMNPVSLAENHPACRMNRAGDRVLPNGQVWKPQLLLLCFASKILAEANSLLKLQDSSPGKPFGQRSRVPPLPFLLSSLLQSRALLKLPDEQVGDEDESDESDEDDDSDDEEDYDQLPPFRRLAKEEIAELDEVNRGQYFEELAERERLFQKKQWREELKRRRELKRRGAEAPADQSQFGDEGLEEEARAAAVPVPMPDMVLPPSFDSDNPAHRYRYLETANQWLVRPVLDTHGWDHDNGYDGMSVEKMFVVGDKIPTSVSGQITKDKKEANLNMECAASVKHGEGKVTLAGLDLQTVGKDLAYTLRSETRFSNFKGNKTTGGLSLTLLGDTVSAGMKIEDRLIAGKRVKLVVNGGAMTGGGDVAYGGSLEATLRDKEYPLSRTLSTLGLSIMDWHGDLAVGGNLQSQFILGKTMMVGRANLNNRGAGQISIRASSSEQLQMTLIGIIPIVRAIANRLFGQSQQ